MDWWMVDEWMNIPDGMFVSQTVAFYCGFSHVCCHLQKCHKSKINGFCTECDLNLRFSCSICIWIIFVRSQVPFTTLLAKNCAETYIEKALSQWPSEITRLIALGDLQDVRKLRCTYTVITSTCFMKPYYLFCWPPHLDYIIVLLSQ